MSFVSGVLLARVQVGVMAHAWTIAGPNDISRTRSENDYVRFAPQAPNAFDDCTTAFAGP